MRSASYLADVPRPGYLAHTALHGPLRFEFRPARIAERSALADLSRLHQEEAFCQEVAVRVAERLLQWDLADAQGQPVAISSEIVGALEPELFLKLYQVVFGYIASDIDPSWPSAVREDLHAEDREATVAGRSIGEWREERELKN